MRRTAGYTWTDYKTNTQIAKELKITQILDKLLEYKRSWIERVNRMPRNRLPRVMKYYSPTGRRNHVDLWRDFWIRETGTGQQVAQLHERYMMMMMMMMMMMTTMLWDMLLSNFYVGGTCYFDLQARRLRRSFLRNVSVCQTVRSHIRENRNLKHS